MMKRSFYVDACIYINLWQKEGYKRFGTPYWKIAKDFFEKYDDEKNIIYYSGFLLKEMKFVLDKDLFYEKKGDVQGFSQLQKDRHCKRRA